MNPSSQGNLDSNLHPAGDSAGQVLGYEPRFERSFIRRHGKRLGLAILTLSLAVTAYFTWRPLMDHVLWLYWSHRCAAFQMPAGVELVVSDPKQKQLLANNPDYVPVFYGGGRSTLAYSPRAWRQLCNFDERSKAFRVGFFGQEAITFLGTRSRPDGQKRLIIINGCETNGFNLLCELEFMALPLPGVFDSMPKHIRPQGGGAYSGAWIEAKTKAGVADPNDPTHFTIDVVVTGTPPPGTPTTGTIDAYLQNDDSLKLSLRTESSKNGYLRLAPSVWNGWKF